MANDFPQLLNNLYLDSAGCPPVPKPLLEAFNNDLQTNHFGNPHSNHNSGSLTDFRVSKMRRRILEYDIIDLGISMSLKRIIL